MDDKPDYELSVRDARITVSGIMQAVINSGADPSEWRDRTIYGLTVHANLTKQMLGTKTEPTPTWEGWKKKRKEKKK